jgi:ElaB/YqjD/DUF883 family membrane-anchored ribosome-binding protein
MDEGARAAGSPVDPAATEQGSNEEAHPPRSPEEIRADIEQTRGEVGDTVEALASKTDVKAQAKAKVEDIKGNVRERADVLKTKAQSTTPDSAQQGGQQVVAKVREKPAPFAIGGAILLGFLLGRLTGKRGDDY